jgi:soluble lytic murein transglycosylase
MAGHPDVRAKASGRLTALAAALLLCGPLQAAVRAPETTPKIAGAIFGDPGPFRSNDLSWTGSEALRAGCAAPEALERLASDPGPDGARAALRLGLCRLGEGRAKEGAALLDLGSRHRTLRAYALLWAGEAAAASGDAWGARRRLEGAVQAGLPAPARVRARLRLAELKLDLGDPHGAEQDAWEALGGAADDEQRAFAWHLLGRASERLGRRREAQERYALSWWGFPGTAASRTAFADLHRMSARPPAPPALARVERARRLSDPRASLAEWRAALRQGLSGALAAEAWLQVGLLERGPVAVQALRRAAEHPLYRARAWFWTGRVLAREGKVAQARAAWLRVVRDHPNAPWAARALRALASHADASGDPQGADRYLALLARRFPGTELAGQADWQRGWIRYLQGRYAEAEEVWVRAARRTPGRWAAASLYWAAKSRSRRGMSGRTLLAELIQRYPHTYYGQLARRRLGAGPQPPPQEPEPVQLPAARFAPAAVELAALGLYREAAEAAQERLRSEPSPFLRRLAGWALAALKDLAGSVEVAEAAGLPYGPAASDAVLWRLAYPLAYRDLVWRVSEEHGVDPLLVLAVMREESRFRADAVSAAGAVGLMQVLPSTARGMDPSAGPKDLRSPDRNVRLGVAYLAGRLREFADDVGMALVAYNAGPAAARRFRSLRGTEEDEFVERIPYAETRAYVKRVLESYGIYRWLYGGRR